MGRPCIADRPRQGQPRVGVRNPHDLVAEQAPGDGRAVDVAGHRVDDDRVRVQDHVLVEQRVEQQLHRRAPAVVGPDAGPRRCLDDGVVARLVDRRLFEEREQPGPIERDEVLGLERRERNAAWLDPQDATGLDRGVAAAAPGELGVPPEHLGERDQPSEGGVRLGAELAGDDGAHAGTSSPAMTAAPSSANRRIRASSSVKPGARMPVVVDEAAETEPSTLLVGGNDAGALPEGGPGLLGEPSAVATRRIERDAIECVVFRAGHDRHARPPERAHIGVHDVGRVSTRDELGQVEAAIPEPRRQLLGVLLERAHGRRAVREGRIGGNAVPLEDKAVRVLERQWCLLDKRGAARLHQARPDLALDGNRVLDRCRAGTAVGAGEKCGAPLRRDLQEQRLLERHRHVPLLEHDPVDGDRGAISDVLDDGVVIEGGGEARRGEVLPQPAHHLARPGPIGRPRIARDPVRLGGRRAKRVDTLPAQVHPARVTRIVDPDPGLEQVVHHRDELDAEQGQDPHCRCRVCKASIDTLVVEVRRPDDPHPLRAGGRNGRLGRLEGREVGWQVDMGVDDRIRRRACTVRRARLPHQSLACSPSAYESLRLVLMRHPTRRTSATQARTSRPWTITLDITVFRLQSALNRNQLKFRNTPF